MTVQVEFEKPPSFRRSDGLNPLPAMKINNKIYDVTGGASGLGQYQHSGYSAAESLKLYDVVLR